MDSNPRRLRRTTAWCLVVVGAIILCSIIIGPAFTDPAAYVTKPGSLQVLVEAPDGALPTSFQAAVRAVVIESKIEEEDGDATYTIHFPASLEGLDFSILLAGSAVLQDLPPIVDRDLVVEEGSCQDPQVIAGFYEEDLPCQVMSGTVGGEYRLLLQGCRDETRPDQTGDYYDTMIYGTSGAKDREDWAHDTTNMADLDGWQSGETVQNWNGFAFARPMTDTYPTTCQFLETSDESTRHVSSSDPTNQGAAGLSWGPEYGSSPFAVTSTGRSAGLKGNLLLALLGLLGAVLIGVASATSDAWRSRKRYVRWLEKQADEVSSGT